jgi:L-threonylcarbamoyladenylate synthase
VRTEIVSATDGNAVGRATELLRQGETVALPTETVYGLAADALREDAVIKIFEAKARPRFDPLIVHLPDAGWVDRVARLESVTGALFDHLCNRFWPGPLTFVFPRQAIIPDVVTSGLDTVAIRLSSHPVFSNIVRDFGWPLAAPSANRFGRISPTSAAHVVDELDGLVPLVVDAGATEHGLESTIVALRNGQIELLRRGPVTAEQLAEFGDVVVAGTPRHPEAPGQLPSHYAPSSPLILVDDVESFHPGTGQRLGLLSWKTESDDRFTEIRLLSARRDLTEAATNLFRMLRELDGCGLNLIVAERVPDQGLGAAINDRLCRAAARL